MKGESSEQNENREIERGKESGNDEMRERVRERDGRKKERKERRERERLELQKAHHHHLWLLSYPCLRSLLSFHASGMVGPQVSSIQALDVLPTLKE